MKASQLLCIMLVVAAAGSAAGAAEVGDQSAASSEESGTTAKEPATSGRRRGRFLSSFLRLLGLQKVGKVPHVQHVQRPIKISPVIVLKPGLYPGSGGCLADSQCSSGYHCDAHKCVQCTIDKHCNPGTRYARTYQKRCVHNRCVDYWVDDVVKCNKYTRCPNGQYCSAGVCRPFVPEWMPCTADKSCRSNSCLQRTCAECSQWKPCSQGQFCDHGHCKYPGKPGDSCWRSLHCKSHICWHGGCAECAHSSDCKSYGKYCEQGRCKSLGSFGDKCSDSSQCSSKICDTKTQSCIDCKNSVTCAEGNYCNAEFQCVQKGAIQDKCTYDYHCMSNRCGPADRCVECNRLHDCDSSTQFCDITGGGTCQPLRQLDENCDMNEHCQSSLTCSLQTRKCVQCQINSQCGDALRCDNDLGVCVAKSAKGEKCVGDSDCDTDVCGLASNTCVECRVGLTTTCSPTQMCSDQGICEPIDIPLDGMCITGKTEQCQLGLVCTNLICTLSIA